MSLGTLTARVALDTSPLSAGVKAAAMGFGLVAAGAAAAIYKVGSAYQDSLNTFQAVSSASAAQMAQVGAEAKKLGADMQLPATSAADAAKAMTELAKSGLSVNESMAAAKGTLQLAAAAQVDEAKAAEISANALNAFGLKGAEAGRVADILAASANASSAEITDMADALKMSGAVAAAAHIPIEDLAAALGELANKGVKGSDAGTSVKQMLLSLEGPSKKAAKVMSDYGIDIYTADGRMKSFRDIIANVSSALGGLGDEQRNAALATIFGSDAVRAANIVLLGGVDAFDQMKAAVTKNGAAADLATAKTKGLRGAFEGLKSQLEGVAITLYEKAAPGVERFVRSVAEGIPTVVAQLATGGKAFQAAFSGESVNSAGFVGVMERIGVAARTFVEWFKQEWPQIKTLGASALDALKASGETLGPILQVVANVLKDMVEKAPALKPVLDGLAESFRVIGGFIGDHIEGFTQLAEIVGVIMVARLAALKAQLAVTFAEEVIASIRAFTTATAAAEVATTGMGAAAGVAGVSAGSLVTVAAALTAGIVILSRTIIDHNSTADKMAQGFIDLERHIPIVGGYLADLDASVFGVSNQMDAAAVTAKSLHDRLVDYARGYEATVTIDASQAFRTMDQLREDLAYLNQEIAATGPGGGKGAARNEVQAQIDEQSAGPNNENTGTAGDPSSDSGPTLDHYAIGGFRKAAAGWGSLGSLGPGGGRPHGPTLVSEGGFDEWVITPDPARRLRNLALWNQAGQALGASAPPSAVAPMMAPIDYDRLGAAVAAALVATPLRATVSSSAVSREQHASRRR